MDDTRRLDRCVGSANGFCGRVHVRQDEVLFADPDGSGVISNWTKNTINLEMVPDPEIGQVSAVEASPLGLVANRSDAGDASLYVREAGTWDLNRRLSSQRAAAAVANEDSLLIARVLGFLTELRVGGDCDTIGGGSACLRVAGLRMRFRLLRKSPICPRCRVTGSNLGR